MQFLSASTLILSAGYTRSNTVFFVYIGVLYLQKCFTLFWLGILNVRGELHSHFIDEKVMPEKALKNSRHGDVAVLVVFAGLIPSTA